MNLSQEEMRIIRDALCRELEDQRCYTQDRNSAKISAIESILIRFQNERV